jgi:hypothetical protein
MANQLSAYELADALQETEPYYSTDYKLFDKAAAMLRQFGLAESIIKQQQLEIEALRKENADMNRRLLGWDIYEQ